MSRAERLLALMQNLRRHRRPIAGSVLAQELGISLRTLYRDIACLRLQGAPIDGEAGVGYVLNPGFLLPPLMFSTTELDALMLGAGWVARHTDGDLARDAANVLAKIAAVLPDELSPLLDDPVLLIGMTTGTADGIRHLPVLRQAIRQERKVAIRYRDAEDRESLRTVWPFVLGFFEQVRVLAAWCELRQDIRHFRVDRLVSVETRSERYPKRRASLLRQWREREGVELSIDC